MISRRNLLLLLALSLLLNVGVMGGVVLQLSPMTTLNKWRSADIRFSPTICSSANRSSLCGGRRRDVF